ncbi:MAG: ABC transporter permease [Chlamydiales bacterium]|nr:ABC transporter permease [Chlamydiales bacterium]
MIAYLVRRILLLPLTLFAIILVNFVILNLAPGDPVNQANLSATGEATRATDEGGVTGDNQYLMFREHYGLTLPILFNTWPSLSEVDVSRGLDKLTNAKEEMSVQSYHELKRRWGDRAKFIMPHLLREAAAPENSFARRRMAANIFIRGGLRQGHVGAVISAEKRAENREISNTNLLLSGFLVMENDTPDLLDLKVNGLAEWFEESGGEAAFTKKGWAKSYAFFFETRFSRYLSRVFTLNFGTLRNDSNKTVISEVAKRIKYSLTLALIPMLATFALCQIFGMFMALRQNQWPDYTLNISFLILFAVPIFVVAPFLIEKIALNHTFPFTNISIPYSGFHSTSEVYDAYTSPQRLADTAFHLFLPLIAIMYGTLAVQARLSRTAFLEVLRQDHVRTARAKGLSKFNILVKHVGRNGAITIVTSLAASLGVILGGSLIVETIFEINGFGRFFYDAILNRDYNVVLFSAFAGSFLTLIGYLLADIAYTLLDPRISFE